MDSDEILSALESDFEDSGSEYNFESDYSSDSIQIEDYDDNENIDDGGNTTPTQISPTRRVQANVTAQCTWFDVTGDNKNNFLYTGDGGIKCDIAQDCKPIDVFNLFLNEEVLNLIVTETNRQAQWYKRQWTETDSIEIKKFLAIVMYTGLISYPKLSDYWSHQPLFQNSFVPKIMPRNRFQELLRFFHVLNNDINPTDRLGKIQPLIDILVNLFKQGKVPAENVVIDETLIPFRGRIIFRQYIPNKAAKYRIKLYKLCDSVGYTYDLSVYSGKLLNNVDTNNPYAGKLVMSLLENYLNEGRTLIVDNFYTSLHIAHVLLDHNTHIVGTLRKNVKICPKDIMNAKLQKGDIVGKENVHGVVVSNWRDKRDVRFLSTKHGIDIVNTVVARKANAEQLKLFELANRIHFYHTIVLLAVPFCRFPRVTGALFVSGSIIFCGNCYYNSMTGGDKPYYNKYTTAGGIILVTAWLLFSYH